VLVLVGRDPEQAELDAALLAARGGHGRAVLLLGEPGIGKSALADDLVDRAMDGTGEVRVGRGACAVGGMPPLWAWRRALPDLDWSIDEATPTSSDRELLTSTVIDSLSDGPARLLVLEDLHWADPATLMLTHAVAEAAPGLPLLLVLTCRDDPAELPDAVRDLPTSVRRVPLAPLDVAGVAELARAMPGDRLTDEQVRDVASRTGGNPFFVHEVVTLLRARGPGSGVPVGVEGVLQNRLARLSQPCVAYLTVAALAAETSADVIDEQLVSAVTGLDGRGHLEQAVAARLVQSDAAGRYRFRHALVREVLSGQVTATDGARWHRLIAEGLTDASAARLAHHWARSADGATQTAEWSLRAAREAMSGLGFEAAAEHFRRALEHPDTDPAVRIELGEALQLCGDTATARLELLTAAEQLAGRPEQLAQAALALGGGLAGFEVALDDPEQVGLLRRADNVLTDGALRAAVRGRLSLALAGTASIEERIALAREACAMAADAADPQVEAAVLAAYCDAIAGPDHVEERAAAARRMIELSADPADLRQRAVLLLAQRLLLVALLERGDLTGAEQQAAAYERAVRRGGAARYAWLPEIWRGMRALLDGRPEDALRHADAAEGLGRRADSLNADLMAFAVRMQAHLDLRNPELSVPAVHRILGLTELAALPAMYFAAPARLLLATGDPGLARSVLRAFVDGGPGAMPRDAEWLEAHWALADIAISLADREAAARLYDTLLPYRELWAVDGIGAAVFGMVAEQLGRLAEFLRRPGAAELLDVARRAYARAPGLLDHLGGRPTGSARLTRDGRFWRVEWQGRLGTVADSKGMRDLAVLLARPGRPVPALELVEAAGGPPRAAAGADLGPVLDDRARREYRRRLEELGEELAEAEADADLGRISRLREERSMLADELAGALGLAGRPRVTGDPADRARKAVTMRIRAAIAALAEQDESLGRHLDRSVRTGRLCSYEPETPVEWTT
jgi:hypothetical protein